MRSWEWKGNNHPLYNWAYLAKFVFTRLRVTFRELCYPCWQIHFYKSLMLQKKTVYASIRTNTYRKKERETLRIKPYSQGNCSVWLFAFFHYDCYLPWTFISKPPFHVLTLYTPTSVCIFSILFSIHSPKLLTRRICVTINNFFSCW